MTKGYFRKDIYSILNSSKKRTKKFVFRSNCFRFLEELKTPKGHFEINWPLSKILLVFPIWTLNNQFARLKSMFIQIRLLVFVTISLKNVCKWVDTIEMKRSLHLTMISIQKSRFLFIQSFYVWCFQTH